MGYLLRESWRGWKSAKAVAALAVAALAAGIGCATAIYSVVDAVLLRPLPYAEGNRFVALFGAQKGETGISSVSWLNLLEFQRRMRTFDAFGIYQPNQVSLTSPGQPRDIRVVEVSSPFVRALGVNPILGRWFDPDSEQRGNFSVAVISESLWQSLGRSPAILGQTLTLDSRPYTVTGVMPGWFRFPASNTSGSELRADAWMPLNPRGSDRNRTVYSYFAYARLRPGVTVAQADEDAKGVAAEFVREGLENSKYTAVVEGVQETVVKEIRPTLLLLGAASLVLLIITCANVAGLLLARSVGRSRETAIRVAMGATRHQLVIKYFSEGLLVALAGAAAGSFIALALLRFVLSVASDYIPRADEIGLNWSALLFAIGIAVAASLLFSLAPLWQAMKTTPNEVLSDGARSSSSGRTRYLSRSLVVAEIALAFSLLSTGALLLAHLNTLLDVNPGFDPAQILTFDINLNPSAYPDTAHRNPYLERLEKSIRSIPGVREVSIVNHLPLAGCCFYVGMSPEFRPRDPARDKFAFMVAGPKYLATMRIPLIKGRFFNDSDTSEHILTAVINQSAANQFWPGREPVGAFARFSSPNDPRVRIVGVIGDVRQDSLAAAVRPEVYFPAFVFPMNPVRFVVRSSLGMPALLPRIRSAVAGVNPIQAINDPRSMRDILLGSLTTQRLQSFLTGFFSLAALLMAALGVYGVASYSVRHRTTEIGTRMALGAVSRDILTMVIGDGFRMAGWGVVAGGVAVIASALLLRSQIFGIQITSLAPFLVSTAIVITFTAAACFFPAWRATLVSPMVAIRDDAAQLRSTHLIPRSRTARSAEDDLDESALLTEFLEASGMAQSYVDAIHIALDRVRDAVHAEWAVLLEHNGSAFEAQTLSLPAAGLLARRLRFYPHALPLTPADFDAWERSTSGHEEEIAALRAQSAALAVPLVAKREMEGILLLGPRPNSTPYSREQRRVLAQCAAQFALMVVNARLARRMLEQEKIQRDVQLAIEVQKRLFPDRPPANPSFGLAGISVAARSVGGDYYDFFDLGEGRIGIALADVAGKGVAAALIMSVVQASLRILAADRDAPLSEIAAKMNRHLHRATGSNAYATFFYGQVDERERRLRYVNAGHNPPCLLRYVAPHPIEELPAGGTVIGLFPDGSYQEGVVDLLPGDVLMAFTDGVPEALNPAEEEYGEDRLKDLLRRHSRLPINEMASAILAELRAWIADAAQYDDLTFVLLKVSAS